MRVAHDHSWQLLPIIQSLGLKTEIAIIAFSSGGKFIGKLIYQILDRMHCAHVLCWMHVLHINV
jgi:hypothetical protein